jgi:hypothetical protein
MAILNYIRIFAYLTDNKNTVFMIKNTRKQEGIHHNSGIK